MPVDRRHLALVGFVCLAAACAHGGDDYLRDLQTRAIEADQSPSAHWGMTPDKYTQWGSHSNRLIPVYTFGTLGAGPGIDLTSYTGENSPYRSAEKLRAIYGYDPSDSVNSQADYLDQTNIYDVQAAALKAGKKHIILVIFDGMDWVTTRAAAIYNTQSVGYTEGRGHGTHFQDYTAGGNTQFGFMVTSPHNDGTKVNINEQQVLNPGGSQLGGYNPNRAGDTPWATPSDERYLIGQPKEKPGTHAYTDSSSSASSMSAGVKTFNNAVNVDASGTPVTTIAHEAQDDGYAVGVVTAVPIPHATPACMYAVNVDRDDYQDLTRDLIGLPSISHPSRPTAGLDVVIGCGWGVDKETDKAQGENFVPGNRYLTAEDLAAVDVQQGGRYVVAQREPGVSGKQSLQAAANQAAQAKQRLLGFYGAASHLPFQTANGDYKPAPGRTKPEKYTPADLAENPTLADMAAAALEVLSQRDKGFWLMVEAGDVDWANHDDNLDNSIGAVNSGAAAVKVITDWVEQHSNWNETVLIVTADHGHYLVLDRPEDLIRPQPAAAPQ
ncbi:MAG: alkaline phosphatase [Planctomycetaceae bacterium]